MKRPNLIIILLIIIAIATLLIAKYCFWNGAIKATKETYVKEMQDTHQKTYDKFYNLGYEKAKAAHQVVNTVQISIDDIHIENILEVLNVWETIYEISEEKKGKPTAWLEVPGNGIFTVDLKSAEFIIDSERAHVLIRLPKPECTHITMDYEGVELLYYDEAGFFSDSEKGGSNLAEEQLSDAKAQLEEVITTNQSYYTKAEEATERILTNLVEEVNPNVVDIEIEIEFLEE